MVYVFLANGFEETEAVTPVDILRRAGVGVKTVAVGTGSRAVTGSHGITVTADIAEDELDVSDAEMLVLPGGMPGADNLNASKTVESALSFAVEHELYIGAICAAPYILGERGYLFEHIACCYPGFEKRLESACVSDRSVEFCRKIITARSAAAAMNFALTLVSALCGMARAEEVADAVLYDGPIYLKQRKDRSTR